MPIDTAEIVVAANGSLSVAPFGTALPDDIDDALNAAFLDVGLTDETGVAWTVSKTIKDIPAWQLFFPARKILTGMDAMAKTVLQQWNADNLELAYGGGAVTTTANGFMYTPPDPGVIDERSAVIDWQDGTKNYRLVIEKCMVTENVETTLARTDASKLPVTLGIIGVDGAAPWYFLTDDAAFATGS